MATALITGVAQDNIGYAAACRFAEMGYALIICDLQPSIDKIAGLIAKTHRVACEAVHGDLTDEHFRTRLFDGAFQRHPDLDVLVNSAGMSCPTRPLDITVEEWRKVYAINTETTFFCCQSFIRHLITHKRPGAIVNVASIAGRTGGLHNGQHYASSKAAIISFSRGLARAFGSQGIRVNAIAPGIIDTPMSHAVKGSDAQAKSSPIGRWGTVWEVADAIAFLAGKQSTYITGTTLDINGGLV